MDHDEIAYVAAQQLAAYYTAAQLALLRFDISSEIEPLATICQRHLAEAIRVYTSVRETIRAARGRSPKWPEGAPAEDLMRRLSEEVIGKLKTIGALERCVTHEEKANLLSVMDKLIADADRLAEESITQLAGVFGDAPSGASGEAGARIERRTVVSVDVSQYGRLSILTEDILGTDAVFKLNRDIQALIYEVLHHCEFESKPIVINTGDGAIIVLDPTEVAVRFGELLHELASKRSYMITEKSNAMHFRVGICIGNIAMGTHDIAGTVIARSVRCQSAAGTGQVIICNDTWGSLPSGELQDSYRNGRCEVSAKSHEPKLPAYMKEIVPPAPWDRDA